MLFINLVSTQLQKKNSLWFVKCFFEMLKALFQLKLFLYIYIYIYDSTKLISNLNDLLKLLGLIYS